MEPRKCMAMKIGVSLLAYAALYPVGAHAQYVQAIQAGAAVLGALNSGKEKSPDYTPILESLAKVHEQLNGMSAALEQTLALLKEIKELIKQVPDKVVKKEKEVELFGILEELSERLSTKKLSNAKAMELYSRTVKVRAELLEYKYDAALALGVAYPIEMSLAKKLGELDLAKEAGQRYSAWCAAALDPKSPAAGEWPTLAFAEQKAIKAVEAALKDVQNVHFQVNYQDPIHWGDPASWRIQKADSIHFPLVNGDHDLACLYAYNVEDWYGYGVFGQPLAYSNVPGDQPIVAPGSHELNFYVASTPHTGEVNPVYGSGYSYINIGVHIETHKLNDVEVFDADKIKLVLQEPCLASQPHEKYTPGIGYTHAGKHAIWDPGLRTCFVKQQCRMGYGPLTLARLQPGGRTLFERRAEAALAQLKSALETLNQSRLELRAIQLAENTCRKINQLASAFK